MSTPFHDRVARDVAANLCRKGVYPTHAQEVGQQVLAELDRDPQTPVLWVVRVSDHVGQAHACVVPEPMAGSVPMFRIDLERHRASVRGDQVDEFKIDLAIGDDATRI